MMILINKTKIVSLQTFIGVERPNLYWKVVKSNWFRKGKEGWWYDFLYDFEGGWVDEDFVKEFCMKKNCYLGDDKKIYWNPHISIRTSGGMEYIRYFDNDAQMDKFISENINRFSGILRLDDN